MRVVLSVFLVLVSLVVGHAQSSLRNIEKIAVGGTEYVRLLDWCNANDLKLAWTKRDETLRATNRLHRLMFAVESRRIEMDGVAVLLSHQLISRNGVPLVSTLDLLTTLHPLLYPQQVDKTRIKTICLDAGHGGKDTGQIDSKGGLRKFEKTYTLFLTEEVSKLLQQKNFKVVYSRNRDSKVELSERADIANRAKADLFVSLHFNSAAETGVSGLETFCMSPAGVESSNAGGGRSSIGNYAGNASNTENMVLAYQIQKSILSSMRMEDRGVKRARFEVLREAKMPAILIEGGFMSNPAEARKIYDPAWRKRMAQSIVDGILNYKKLVEPEPELVAKTNPPVKETRKKTARN